ncbi:LytR/AlgR family response regulator transcription factor [uncultured Polaribacter sp.]|jgi:DNA-binding LytR/AlgR family response regulator|uniref:LytR/AlgR family response regulator transcription factor n=1 Tax=uncultured Polaribacter sp. TaxID=174711 RepID=UPI003704720D
MKIKCVIIDDEPLAIKVIENHLKEFQNFEVIGTFNNPIIPLNLLENGEADVLFLDINMPKMNGLDFAKTLNTKTNVVITTAYREYAVESYDLNVLDYLVKPIPFNRFLKTINKITQKVHHQKGIQKEEDTINESFIFLKVDKKLVKIKFDAILYIESLKDYIKVFTTTENYLVHKSLTSITEELPDTNFIRIHRSYTIAIDKVKSLEGNLLEIGIARIPIGRKYVSHAKRIILNTGERNR